MKNTLRIKRILDLDLFVAPGFTELWRKIKASCRTSVRCPKSVTVTDEPTAMYPDDDACARRFAVDLHTMAILGEVHVSCGGWAISNRGQDKGVIAIPNGQAVVSCEWSDFHRYFSMTVEVPKGTLPAEIKGLRID
jgi:hypothetical protein